MSQTTTLSELAESLAGTFPGSEDASLARALLQELSRGVPVSTAQLARAAGRNEPEVSLVLERWPNVQRDHEQRVVAFGGLSLDATAHRFDVGDRQLYTWCAWDTLFLPRLLNERARVGSTCPITGTEVRLTVAPDRVLECQPRDLWVSFPSPSRASVQDITGSFCCHVHFLAGDAASARWLADHDGGFVLPLEDAFELGRLATRDCWTPESAGGR